MAALYIIASVLAGVYVVILLGVGFYAVKGEGLHRSGHPDALRALSRFTEYTANVDVHPPEDTGRRQGVPASAGPAA